MDRMTFPEIECLVDNMWMKNKESWEQARTIGYITAQCQSSKQIDPKDMLSFPWEKKEVHQDTPEELQSLKEEMMRYEKKLNNR